MKVGSSLHGLTIASVDLLVGVAWSSRDVRVVSLSFLVDLLLLFPAVEENLEDEEGAGDNEEDYGHHVNDKEHVDPVFAILVATRATPVSIKAPGLFEVGGKGIDHKDRKCNGAQDQKNHVDVVDDLAHVDVVRLDDNKTEEASEYELEGEVSPLSSDCRGNGSEQVEHANEDGALSEGHAAAAAIPGFSCSVHAHFILFNTD